MTSRELMPYCCDLPMRYRVDAFEFEEIHYWYIIGLAGTLAFRAVKITDLPYVSSVIPRDSEGTHWLGSGLEFHGVAPIFGDLFFADCPITNGRCWSADTGGIRAMALIERVLPFVNRDMQIHRALTAEYHTYVAGAWLDAVRDEMPATSGAWPFDDREINDVASDLL